MTAQTDVALTGSFRRKIKNVSELVQTLGPRPRTKKVIMCHGTFDIVHPGHIRHLLYARGKGDVLVASLTSDVHIEKGKFRPFVPEDLRAMNLAALELVDWVVIDPNPTPLEHLALLQPDYFAKGYEYVSAGVHPKTADEIRVLESYGGEMIFTPGDVVFSSSRLIDSAPPDLAADKLHSLLEAEGVTFSDLRSAVEKLRGIRVHVVGDTIVDSYTQTTLIGGNAKTPTFSVRYDRTDDFAGGAAIVAKHLRAAGADVVFSTVLGKDRLGEFVAHDLREAGIEARAIVDPTRPTTHKNAFVAGGYRLLKVDTLDNRTISDRILEELSAGLQSERGEIVLMSDFRHGIFDRRTIPRLVSAIPAGAFRVADSQVASRWGNILDFADFDLITPNEKEARFALGDQDSVIRPLALELYRKARCKTLVLKLGDRGILVYRRDADRVRSFFAVESFADRVVDAVGAGDALVAYTSLAMVATKNEVIAAVLGCLAAGIECERDGNIPVQLSDLQDKIAKIEQRVHYA